MLDQSDLPRIKVANEQTFYALGATGVVEWQPWVKPRNISMISIIDIGAGGGGGGGMTGAAGTARGGGGGGGSGAITTLLIPAIFVPDILYVMVGRGGLGAAATGIGSSGDRSFVGMMPQNPATVPMVICSSGAASSSGGAAGTAATGGAGGAAGTIAIMGGALGHNLGLFVPRAGQAGAAGGAQTGGTGNGTIHANVGLPITGGAGGGGTPVANTDFLGGAVSGIAGSLMPHSTFGGTAGGGAGAHGMFLTGNPIWTTTGGGGGGTNGAAGVGGRGGDAAYGSGGGGGGGGVTGGAGGNGGNGLVIITCW